MGTTDGSQFIIKVYEGSHVVTAGNEADLNTAKVIEEARITVKDLAARTFTATNVATGTAAVPATVTINSLKIDAKTAGATGNGYVFNFVEDTAITDAVKVTFSGKNVEVKYNSITGIAAALNADTKFNELFTATTDITAAGTGVTVNGANATGATVELNFDGKMTEATSVTMTINDGTDNHVVTGTITDWTTNTATVEFAANVAVVVANNTITKINLVSNNGVAVNMTTPVTIN